MPTGKIKMFNEHKGFGFIQPDAAGSDVFFHVSALREDDDVTVGKKVKFEVDRGLPQRQGLAKRNGPKAITVDLI